MSGFCRLARADESADSNEPTEPVEEMVVFGEPRPAMDVLRGASTTRVETDERLIEGAGIDDLLAEMPGVQIRRFGGAGERYEISIRGSRPEQVPVLLDGFRIDSSLTGRGDLSSLCLDVLQEIQVTRGAGAARYGSGAIGGVVHLVSRRPGAEPETRVRGAAGSFDTYEGSLRHSRRIGAWDLSLGYCGFHTRGDFEYQQIGSETNGTSTAGSPILKRTNNEAERHTGLAQIGRGLGDGRLRLNQLVTYLDRGVPGLAITDTQLAYADETDLASLTGLAFEHPIRALPKGRLDLGLGYRYERDVFKNPVPQIATDEPIDTRTEVQGLIGSVGVGTTLQAFAARHELTLLAEGRYDTRSSNEASSESRQSIAVRGELESRWWKDRIGVMPSLRMERYTGLDVEWLPSLGIEVEVVEDLTLRGAVSRSYRAPSFEELYLPDKGFESGNPDLEPEEAWSYEIGATLTSPFLSPWLDFEIEATYFASHIDQSITFQYVSPTRLSYVNTGEAKTWGYELSARWRPHEWIRASASRTVTHARQDSSDCPIAGIAASQTDGRIELGPPERFKVVGEVHYTGRVFLDDGCQSYLPSRVSYDASASVDLTEIPLPYMDRLGQALWLSVRGRNLGNVSQYDTASFPRPGRNFSIALEGVF